MTLLAQSRSRPGPRNVTLVNSGADKHRPGNRQRGAALVEMAIVILVFLVLVFGIIEFARAIFEWSRLVEATRAGARYAIVNDPACNIFDDDWESGDPQYLRQACSSGPLDCATTGGVDETSMTIAGDCPINESSEKKEDAACKIVSKHVIDSSGLEPEVVEYRGNMRAIQPMINSSAANVTITYTCTDAGFAGNAQAIPSVTVEVNNVPYSFLVTGLLGIHHMDEDPDDDKWSITMPSFETTRTGEDLAWIRYTGE